MKDQVLFNEYIQKLDVLGLDASSAAALVTLFDSIRDEQLRSAAKDASVLADTLSSTYPPNTLGALMEQTPSDYDVLVRDKDGVEHEVPGIFNAERWGTKENTVELGWMMHLPIESIWGNQATLLAPFGQMETEFLLTGKTDDPELRWRTELAAPDFEERLAFLQEGKPFERPLDGTCMDSVELTDRKLLCEFISDHANVFVTPMSGSRDGHQLFEVYAFDVNSDGTLNSSGCPVKLVKTKPGQGFAFTLTGRIYYAEHKAKHAEMNVRRPLKDLAADRFPERSRTKK